MIRNLLLATLAFFSMTACGSTEGPAQEPSQEVVEMRIRYSAFRPASIEVPAGTAVRFVIENTDPIDHEFIVGPPEVHERHERGNEPSHGEVPGEVTIPADSTAETTYTFDEPGRVRFACHLPGHLEYGMKGWVTVTA